MQDFVKFKGNLIVGYARLYSHIVYVLIKREKSLFTRRKRNYRHRNGNTPVDF